MTGPLRRDPADPLGPAFAGRVAIVTGASSLMATAAIEQLLAGGARVVATDIPEQEHLLTDVAGSSDLRFIGGDLADDAHLTRVANLAIDEFGGVDHLVNAAAVFVDPGLAATHEQWHRSLDVNVIAAARLISLCQESLASRGGGSIVNVASISGLRAQPDRLLYPVTKAAVLGMTRNCAMLLAGQGTRVNAVLPGWTWSRNIERRYGTRERADAFAAEFQPMGRLADPAEIADAIVYLLSDRASFITGAELCVDGGYAAAGPEAMGHAFVTVPTISS